MDLQDPVELIPRMVRDCEAGSELVIGHRAERADRWTSRVTSWLFYRIIRMSFPQMPAGGFDYVLMGRRVVDSFNSIEVRAPFLDREDLLRRIIEPNQSGLICRPKRLKYFGRALTRLRP